MASATNMRARRSKFLPFSVPSIEDDDIYSVVDCLKSGWITSGPRVIEFEQAFSIHIGCNYSIAVSSATAGLHLALHALDIGPGDEVIVPSLTWVSTANVVELLGARAVLADVDPATLQLDPGEVARLLSPATRAVIPVHYAGAPADLDAIRAALAGRPITLVEDAAHALGTSYRGQPIGSGSDLAVFSFHPTKNITTGEGGMIACRDAELAARLRLLRTHGISKDAWSRYGRTGSPRYEVIAPGYKYNLSDIHAALGISQLAKLERFNCRRHELAARYDRLLADIPCVRPIGRPAYPHGHAWHLYAVRLDLPRLRIDRDAVMAALAQENIATGLHFAALHEQDYYKRRSGGASLPAAREASEDILSLPLHPNLSDTDQDDVVAALAHVLTEARHYQEGSPS